MEPPDIFAPRTKEWVDAYVLWCNETRPDVVALIAAERSRAMAERLRGIEDMEAYRQGSPAVRTTTVLRPVTPESIRRDAYGAGVARREREHRELAEARRLASSYRNRAKFTDFAFQGRHTAHRRRPAGYGPDDMGWHADLEDQAAM